MLKSPNLVASRGRGAIPRCAESQQSYQGKTLREALECTHGILLAAAKGQMNVYILCDSLRADIWDGLYHDVNSALIGEVLQSVLDQGATISLFVWDAIRNDELAESLKVLIEKRRNTPVERRRGTLNIRASGTNRCQLDVNHFVLAADVASDTNWKLLMEKRHVPLPKPLPTTFDPARHSLPFMALCDRPEANEEGKRLIHVMDQLATAVDHGLRQRST